MNILTHWLREYLPALEVSDRQLAEDLTLRGIAVEGVHEVAGGHLFEMDITTNRVDAMNHYGVAREAAAIYNIPLRKLDDECAPANVGAGYPVRIEAADLCGRFTAQIVRNVTIAPSTGIIAERFAQLGQKPISNAVDITNYTWLAMGHPTHVFDLDTLEGSIVVRRAREGEKLRLLDGSEKTLTADDLVVADEKKALALAGVMGGWDSRVTDTTKNILVEAAWFDPAAIRRSSRCHGLHTDASHRFERGADFAAAPVANRYVTHKLVELCSGTPDGPMTDVVIPEVEAKTANRPRIALSSPTVQRLLGTTLDGGEISPVLIEQYLEALGCSLHPASEVGCYEVKLPSWRLDLEREIDLIEEVARVYGYNRFADTLPGFSGGVDSLPHRAQEETIRNTLRAMGWNEVIGSTFASEEDAMLFAAQRTAVPMGNPLNAEAGVLRPTLLSGAASMLAANMHRDVRTARIFELGAVFTGDTQQVQEAQSLSMGAYGSPAASAIVSAKDGLFFEVKGTIEALLAQFELKSVEFRADSLPPWIAPGRGARVLVESKELGAFGELDAAYADRLKARETIVLGEMDAAVLLASPLRVPLVREPSRFQAVERDLSFFFADTVTWDQINSAVHNLHIAELTSVEPREIYRDAKGKAVAIGEYSLLLRVVLQARDRTLREEEVAASIERIITALKELGGRQRA
ncbi:MAG: phenylalanine--tRNA ligase subunit beta [Acidobacteria bacterium]|nr:phenylalanine--tRNA ligase subunit beta [Acidobacteriota bacterium]